MKFAYIIFEPEDMVVRFDEILRWEALPDGGRLNTSGYADPAPSNARCRVYTKSTGWFFTALDYVTVLERIVAAGEGLLRE